jgi:LysR family glycine cleavage system transcriptional activator
MERLPPIRSLIVFEAVGRLLSMKAAATELAVSPGAISQQIKLLEDALGLRLISRKATGLKLTDFGRSYHVAISSGLHGLRSAHGDALAAHRSSGLVVSALPLFASKWLTPRLFELQQMRSQISIHLEVAITESAVDAGHVDFRISYLDKVRHFDNAVPLFTDSLVPVCSPSLLQSGLRLEHPADLLAYRLLSIDWKPIFEPPPTWQGWFGQAGVSCGQLDDAFVFSLSSLAIEAAIDGRGIALAQQSMILEDVKAGRLVTPFHHRLTLPSPYALAWQNAVFDRPGARDFHRWLVGLARQVK